MMEVNARFLFKGISIDDRTKEYIEKKIQGIVKFLHQVDGVEIEISLDKKGLCRVEVMVKTPYALYRSEETTESIEGSMDVVEDELRGQIKKDKDKRGTLIRRGARSIKKTMAIDEDARF